MTVPELLVRPATREDGDAIIENIRAGFAPSLLEKFIYGCSGAASYVRAHIEAHAHGGDTSYTVAISNEQVVGCIELRSLTTNLFLNYVAVDPTFRGLGMGTRLLRHALKENRRPSQTSMALDVFLDNRPAVAWYHKLGFSPSGRMEWWELPIGTHDAATGLVIGAPHASVTHRVFGFSRVTIATALEQYDTGMLGSRLFRVMRPEALEDPSFMATLRQLDASRNVLALLPEGSLPETVRASATRVAVSERMTIELAQLDARLQG